MKPEEYLNHLISCHSLDEIKLGLDRITKVFHNLTDGGKPPHIPFTYIVGGTNGKGTCAALLEQALRAHGRSTALICSPHLLSFNERACINGKAATDAEWLAALQSVDAHRQGTPLTYFEYCTLAAFIIFWHHQVDVWILEVGLGGRLDAVNIIDVDCALITSIDLDHTEILGDTREKLAYEKLQVARRNKPLIFGDSNPPANVQQVADEIGAKLLMMNRDFVAPASGSAAGSAPASDAGSGSAAGSGSGSGSGSASAAGSAAGSASGSAAELELNNPQLLADNVASSWQALKCYEESCASVRSVVSASSSPDKRFSLDPVITATAWNNFFLAGRWQKIRIGDNLVIMDTGHNPAAAEVIAQRLQEELQQGEEIKAQGGGTGLLAAGRAGASVKGGNEQESKVQVEAIFGILNTKDWRGFVLPLLPLISKWHLFPLESNKAIAPDELAANLQSISDFNAPVQYHQNAAAIVKHIRAIGDAQGGKTQGGNNQGGNVKEGNIKGGDIQEGNIKGESGVPNKTIFLVCGSFHTVGEVMSALN